MQPAEHNFTVVRGGSFENTVQFQEGSVPLNLEGYTVEMAIKRTDRASDFAVVLSNTDNSLTVNTETGTISYCVDTSEWPVTDSDASLLRYDVKLTNPSGKSYFYLQGKIVVEASVVI